MAQEPTPGIGWLQAQFPSIGTLINNVAVEVGLNASAAPLSSTDPNFVQMVVLANKLGKQLMRRCEWQLLNRTYTFQTVNTGPPTPDVTFYALPNDFNRMINQTAWNRTSRLPMAGPLTAQGWEWLVGLCQQPVRHLPGLPAVGRDVCRLPEPQPSGANHRLRVPVQRLGAAVGDDDAGPAGASHRLARGHSALRRADVPVRAQGGLPRRQGL